MIAITGRSLEAIANDKGKPAVKQGRKAKSLQTILFVDRLVAEGDRRSRVRFPPYPDGAYVYIWLAPVTYTLKHFALREIRSSPCDWDRFFYLPSIL